MSETYERVRVKHTLESLANGFGVGVCVGCTLVIGMEFIADNILPQFPEINHLFNGLSLGVKHIAEVGIASIFAFKSCMATSRGIASLNPDNVTIEEVPTFKTRIQSTARNMLGIS